MEANLFFVIVNRGKANALLSKVQECGATGGTVMLGEGTLPSRLLDMLGINQTHKEVLMTAVPHTASDRVYDVVRDEFKLHKRFRGIAFSVPYRQWKPGQEATDPAESITDTPTHLCLITVVEEGKGTDCMAIAREAGAQGGTIIHGHGAGVPQDFYVPLMIEPQKELVLIVAPRATALNVRQAIFQRMKLGEPGNGITFALPVLKCIGLYEERRQEVSR